MKKKKIKEPEEFWRPIIFDYLDKKEPRYYVSTMGRFKAYTHISKGVIIKGSNILGYFAINVSIRSKDKPKIRKSFYAHRVVAETYIPNIDKKNRKKIIHLDYNKKNNIPSNLAWASDQEASDHQRLNPKFADQSITIFNSRLNKKSVSFIKHLVKIGVKRQVISNFFELSDVQIGRIARGKNWGEIK